MEKETGAVTRTRPFSFSTEGWAEEAVGAVRSLATGRPFSWLPRAGRAAGARAGSGSCDGCASFLLAPRGDCAVAVGRPEMEAGALRVGSGPTGRPHGTARARRRGSAEEARARGCAAARVSFSVGSAVCVCACVRALCVCAGLTAGVAWLPLRREGYEGWTTRTRCPHGARAGRLGPVAVFLLGRRVHGGLLGQRRREARGPREWPIAVWCDAQGPGRVCGCVTGATVGCVSPARARGLSGWHLRGTCGGCRAESCAVVQSTALPNVIDD